MSLFASHIRFPFTQAARQERLDNLRKTTPITRMYHGPDIANETDPHYEDIFKLRYSVYCVEKKFLPEKHFPTLMENDKYDNCSTHIATYTNDDIVISSVRLVQPTQNQRFPFQEHCNMFDDFTAPNNHEAAEVSRLVISKQRRKRSEDSLQGIESDNVFPIHDKRLGGNRILLMTMFRKMYQYSKRVGIHYWYAAMEESLVSHIGSMGFKFVPIGPKSDYMGIVRPYIADLREMEKEMRRANWELWEWFDENEKTTGLTE